MNDHDKFRTSAGLDAPPPAPPPLPGEPAPPTPGSPMPQPGEQPLLFPPVPPTPPDYEPPRDPPPIDPPPTPLPPENPPPPEPPPDAPQPPAGPDVPLPPNEPPGAPNPPTPPPIMSAAGPAHLSPQPGGEATSAGGDRPAPALRAVSADAPPAPALWRDDLPPPPTDVAPPSDNPPVVDLPTTEAAEITQVSLWKQLVNLVRTVRQIGVLPTLIEGYDQIVRMITGAPSLRFSQVTPNLFVGGQHIARGLPLLKGRGITGIVSMRREFDDREKGIALDHYIYLPTMDNTPPTLEQLQQGAQFIDEVIDSGGRVYVHCWEGVGRAPTMASAYLITQGMTPDEALATVRKVRPFIRPTPFQIAQLRAFEEAYRQGKFERLYDPSGVVEEQHMGVSSS